PRADNRPNRQGRGQKWPKGPGQGPGPPLPEGGCPGGRPAAVPAPGTDSGAAGGAAGAGGQVGAAAAGGGGAPAGQWRDPPDVGRGNRGLVVSRSVARGIRQDSGGPEASGNGPGAGAAGPERDGEGPGAGAAGPAEGGDLQVLSSHRPGTRGLARQRPGANGALAGRLSQGASPVGMGLSPAPPPQRPVHRQVASEP